MYLSRNQDLYQMVKLMLPAMLGQPHRTTRFDQLTSDIYRTNGES